MGFFKKVIRKSINLYRIIRDRGFKYLIWYIKNYKAVHEQFAEMENRPVEKLAIDSVYQDNIDFSECKTDVKMLAFYLPQYHTFKENDEWWGKGFTEWTNVKKGEARFAHHYQPRVPHDDIGYYDLSDIDVMKKQAKLAKQHGIYGFCFYYYWFSGKRLMEKPVDLLLQRKDIDIPFCLCWANENWTRAWDGKNKNILIGQEYSDNDDDIFIADMKKYIDDERYIRIDGKPLIVVYNPGQIPNCRKTFGRWRQSAKELGIGEILIWTCQTANNYAKDLKIEDCIDAEVEFPPHNMWYELAAIRNVDVGEKRAFLFDYKKIVEEAVKKIEVDKKSTKPVHHACMLAWDNAARRKNEWFTYCGFSTRSLYRWILEIVKDAREQFKESERLVFVNAWNEWGEGTYLEPDEKYGYASINTVSKALFQIPLNTDLCIINDKNFNNQSDDFERKDGKSRIAVQIHMFYLETLEETVRYLNNIPYRFDCYFSTDSEDKKNEIESYIDKNCNCVKCEVAVFENRGRDVAPFIEQMTTKIFDYDYICHIHSKKTKTNSHGNEWREYIFDHLLGNRDYVKTLLTKFQLEDRLGIIMPEVFPVLEYQAEWGGNYEGVKSLLNRLNIEVNLPAVPVFPVGNMFWAKVDAVKNIFNSEIKQAEFPDEAGQVNATLAHQIERSWVYVAQDNGYDYKKVFNNTKSDVKLADKKRLMLYVHYDKNNTVCDEDLKFLKSFDTISNKILFITNSKINDVDKSKIKDITSDILERNNDGYDFGAWRDGLLYIGRELLSEFDEIILCNNSCLAPVFDISHMFETMETKNLDFWGDKIFPYSPDGSYIHESHIDEHLQSYFMVFNNSVIKSDTFWNFWNGVKNYDSLVDVVARCETKLTKLLSDAGFKYGPYIMESYYMCDFLSNWSIPYEKPCSLILLKDPFIKKKAWDYMNEEERVRLEALIKELRPSE